MKLSNNPQPAVSADQRAFFEQVYRSYFDRLYAYALVITRSESMAKDVVSDVFFNLYKSKTDLRMVKELKSYLFTSTKNQVVRALSKDPVQFHSEHHDDLSISIDKVNPEDLLVGKELEEFLAEVIADLPPMCGVVFNLVRQKGMKYAEVAAELDLSVDTVKYHMKTAVKKIKQELEVRYEDTGVIDWYTTGQLMILMGSAVTSII